jgi:beta-fructofuranosidase
MSSPKDSLTDRHRPTFHFMPPANWMNDPNGLIQWNGVYHLFYQYNPNGAFWGTMHWGHATSEDLVHWKHMPVALAPSPEGVDADGCFSGCAVDVNGVAVLMYTGVRGDDQLPCIATSDDDDLSSWEKYAVNPVIHAPPSELETTIFRDHSVWKENGDWFQAIGSGVKGVGGTALLYRSSDFARWQYVDSLVPLEAVSQGIGRDATGWECPDFFELSGQHVLVAAMWDHRPLRVGYFVGSYADQRFTPALDGVVDAGECFYAPQSFTDDSSRRVMFGWLRESRSEQQQLEAGWSGAMSLPRVLSLLDDGSLGTAPAPEVERLRGRHVRLVDGELVLNQALPLEGISGYALELLVTVSASATGRVGVEVLRSADGSERTSVSYEVATKILSLDTRQSSLSEEAIGGEYSIEYAGSDDRPICLHVFVDHSVIEVFINDEKCISGRAYPVSDGASGIRLITADGASAFEMVEAWEMLPSRFTGVEDISVTDD